MPYDGSVKFTYTCKEVPPYHGVDSSFPELLPDETVTIEVPCYDLNVHQYFGMFKKFLGAVGFNESVILQGAFHLAFNDSNDSKKVEELMNEYEVQDRQDPYLSFKETEAIREFLKGKESSWDEIKDQRIRETLNLVTENVDAIRDQQWESRYWALKREILGKGKLSKEEIESIKWESGCPTSTEESWSPWNGLVPGSPEAVKKGCICPVMDNEEMPDDKKWVDSECPIHGKNHET